MTLGLEIYTLFPLYILKLKPNSNYQLHIYVYKLISYLTIIIIIKWQDFTFTSCRPSLEIVTSPIVMHGRSAAQPRVGTHNCQLFKNCLRYLLEILTQYGKHVEPPVHQRSTKSVYRWCCNWHQCSYTSSPTQTLFLL